MPNTDERAEGARPTIVSIADADDPRIASYRNVRERDLMHHEGLFVAESEVVVRVMVGSGRWSVRSMLLEQRRLEGMQDVVDRLDARTTIFVAPQRVMDAIVGFPIHRGVLALGERGLDLHPDELLSKRGMFVGLVGLTNHDNVGGIFRNAAAFGATGVLLDRASCDPLYRKAIRVSVGASLLVPFARGEDPVDLVDRCARRGREVIALTPKSDLLLEDVAREPPRPRVLLLGTEWEGLPDDILARTRRVRIPMSSAYGLDSLNVAVASGIALAALGSRS